VEWAAEKWKTTLYLENDARMAAVGEWKFGAGRGSDDVVVVTIGTGIGSSAIIEGRLLRGKHFQAGVSRWSFHGSIQRE
jgi:glucokinase